MKFAVLAAILTTFVFLSGPDDPALTAARKARDLGNVVSKSIGPPGTYNSVAGRRSRRFPASFDSVRRSLLWQF